MPQPDANSTSPTFCGRGTDVLGVAPADGFCLKHYAQIGEARSLAFAPNGDLFVGAPSRVTGGGASGGPGAIMLLTDDNHDGVAEEHVFLSQLGPKTKLDDVHAVALGGGFLYFTTSSTVWRLPYTTGDRVPSGPPEDLKLPSAYGTGGRFTHGLARSAMGQLLTSKGTYGSCGDSQGGDVSAIAADGTLSPLAVGLRNPMYIRCHATDEVCAAMELGEDNLPGAREKMIMLHPQTNYGFPCCLTAASPVPNISASLGMMCDTVTAEDASFTLNDTPFGFDWEPGKWPAPFTGAVFVARHGSFYSSPQWRGVGIVYAPTDPVTHAPIATSGDAGAAVGEADWKPFQDGFGPGGSVLERPSDIAFSPDGRMFIADDQGGRVFWMAPTTLMAPDATTTTN